ncbi:MAG: ABC transporter ATP-binding protein, partial [Steroidobacteraceae bacterium]
PLSALNPVLRIGQQIGEPLRYHRGMAGSSVRAEVLRLLGLVRIPRASTCMDRYPHELSGGMRQRVMIATAIACKPRVLLADEPTTALDATTQAQVLRLLRDLQDEIGMALILVTHDLGVAAHMADRVAVMYAGELVELAAAAELFARPSHPYTEALLRSLPRVDRDIAVLDAIPGSVPAPGSWPVHCRFAERCGLRLPRCEAMHPALTGSARAAAQVRCVVRGAS